jgi:hypothetical protein
MDILTEIDGVSSGRSGKASNSMFVDGGNFDEQQRREALK